MSFIRKNIKEIFLTLTLIVFAYVMIRCHYMRLSWNVFWMDTAYSVGMIRRPFWDMVKASTDDVHPPLYYYFGKVLKHFLGDTPTAYRGTAFIPYLGILALAVTLIRKYFGFGTSLLVIAFASFTPSSIVYVMEARMYELGLFLALCSFLAFRNLIFNDKSKPVIRWTVFYITTILTAYTHYYLTVSICILYLCVIVYSIFRKKETGYCIICSALAILSYLPRLGVLISNLSDTSGNWWTSGYSHTDENLREIFGYRGFYITALILISVALISRIIMLRAKKAEDKQGEENIRQITLILTGLLMIFLTMGVGTLVSIIIRPYLISRFLYPLSAIGWILMGIGISETADLIVKVFSLKDEKRSGYIAGGISIAVCVFFSGMVISLSYNDYLGNINYQLMSTLETNEFLIRTQIPAGAVIYSDIGDERTIIDCYYPGRDVHIEHGLFYYGEPEADEFYMVWSNSNAEAAAENLVSYGYEVVPLDDNGVLGIQRDVSVLFCRKY
ncbi:MAG: hypothetical protein KBG42_04465 [Lachnospiraceae bacterium]|nr:hypothetical protein [Lachnospiraceae bacterium]